MTQKAAELERNIDRELHCSTDRVTHSQGFGASRRGLGPDRQKLFDPSAHPRRQSWFDLVDLWMIGAIMTHDAAVLKAREIASTLLHPGIRWYTTRPGSPK